MHSLIAAIATMVVLLLASAAAPDEGAPLPPDEVRARRFYREEDPLWRRALMVPADLLELTAWPLRQTLFWMERHDVPEQIEDAVMFPIRKLRGGDSSS